MARAVVVPVGISGDIVEGVLKSVMPVDFIISVTVPGFDDVKEGIVSGLRDASRLVGAKFSHITIEPWSTEGIVGFFDELASFRASEVYVVGVTGSRYLLYSLIPVLLWYWRFYNSDVFLVLGVEGSELRTVPLVGFFAPAMRLSKLQFRILCIVYGTEDKISGKTLKEKYGFTHSVYSVLRDLERKGLLRVRRGYIEKTFPGMIFYHLLSLGGVEKC